jgi:hypothetical protein
MERVSKGLFSSWFGTGDSGNVPNRCIKIGESQSLISTVCFVNKELWCGTIDKIIIWDITVTIKLDFQLIIGPDLGFKEGNQ